MAQFSEDLCCGINAAILGTEQCEKLPGGIEDVRVGCLKFFSAYTQASCAPETSNPGVISAITAEDPETGDPATPLYRVNIKRRTGQHEFALVYDEEADSVTKADIINFDVTAKDDEARCAFQSYIGQEVVVMFKYRGLDEWYIAGWKGGLRVREIRGGSGLDAARNTAFTISGEDVEELYTRFFVTNAGATTTAVDALTN